MYLCICVHVFVYLCVCICIFVCLYLCIWVQRVPPGDGDLTGGEPLHRVEARVGSDHWNSITVPELEGGECIIIYTGVLASVGGVL